MKHLLTCALLLACAVSATAAARVGTRQRPLLVARNPEDGTDNLRGAVLTAASDRADGRNRLTVQAPLPFPSHYAPYVSQDGREFTPALTDGYGKGVYYLLAFHGPDAISLRHAAYGPVAVRFTRRGGQRFYVRLLP